MAYSTLTAEVRMGLDITDADEDDIDVFLNTVLEEYRFGRCELSDARASIAHVIAAARKQNPNFMNEVRVLTRRHAKGTDQP